MRRTVRSAAGIAAAALVLAGCSVAPPADPPLQNLPSAWKTEPPWRESAPRDTAPKGAWWQRFGDAQLDALALQAAQTPLAVQAAQTPAAVQAAPGTPAAAASIGGDGNAALAAAEARLAQARAIVGVTSAGQSPQASLGARATRTRISANRPLANYASPNFSTVQNDFLPSLSVSYQLDVSGGLQQAVAGARAAAEQAAADLENTRLLLNAELATDYFSLRELDAELDVLARSIALQRKALEFVSQRHDLGAASGLEVAQQQALLDSTLTQVDLLKRQRAQFEHAIATLVGQPAPAFAIAPRSGTLTARSALPEIPLGLPSDLLERRPDVASAERAMAAANAQIGVARAAFYPSITLGPTLGYESRSLSTLFDAPSLVWSLGASVSQVLFDGGRLKANEAYARAGHDLAAANYRRTVLTAMQEVEDGITGVAALRRASAQADTAVASARRVLELATGRYEGGAATYLDVITAQQSLLTSERQAVQLQGQSLAVAVFLVKALGGDW